MDARHALGFVGEQSSGFYFGKHGYVAVTGPSGSSKQGHGITASGFDGVYYNPNTDHLVLADNKASLTKNGKIYAATAIDRNLVKNVQNTIKEMKGIKLLPKEISSRVTQLLKQVANNPSKIPSNVSRVVQNAEGKGIQGIGSKLEAKGIIFVPFEKTFGSGADLKTYCVNQASQQLKTATSSSSSSGKTAGTSAKNESTKSASKSSSTTATSKSATSKSATSKSATSKSATSKSAREKLASKSVGHSSESINQSTKIQNTVKVSSGKSSATSSSSPSTSDKATPSVREKLAAKTVGSAVPSKSSAQSSTSRSSATSVSSASAAGKLLRGTTRSR